MSKPASARAPRPEARMVPVEEDSVVDWDDVDEPELDERSPEEIARAEALAAADLNERERIERDASAAIEAARKAEAAYLAQVKLLPHAYAMVQDARGGWYAIHLEGVTAERITRLEPNGRREHGGFALSRVVMAMQRRHHERKWGRPKGQAR